MGCLGSSNPIFTFSPLHQIKHASQVSESVRLYRLFLDFSLDYRSVLWRFLPRIGAFLAWQRSLVSPSKVLGALAKLSVRRHVKNQLTRTRRHLGSLRYWKTLYAVASVSRAAKRRSLFPPESSPVEATEAAETFKKMTTNLSTLV